VRTNAASVLATGLPRASGGAAVPISGFSYPLIEVFHPLDKPPSLQQPAKLRHRFDLGWSGRAN
jgi:hypothetical protein